MSTTRSISPKGPAIEERTRSTRCDRHLIDEAGQLKTQAKQRLMIYGALILLAFWITLISMRKGRRLCLIARQHQLG